MAGVFPVTELLLIHCHCRMAHGGRSSSGMAELRVQLVAQESTKLSPSFVHLGASRGTACGSWAVRSSGTPGIEGLPVDQSASWGKCGGRGSLAPTGMDSTKVGTDLMNLPSRLRKWFRRRSRLVHIRRGILGERAAHSWGFQAHHSEQVPAGLFWGKPSLAKPARSRPHQPLMHRDWPNRGVPGRIQLWPDIC